eukprot:CAMPEP_0184858216 /NCGR_PEP_ID=MMETSP0580-20130426/3340_1 /TAXON_ID=1118495 /ORGANISM="Dactyliosolen fragilissimus" /LENGTH=931 /DNA_ID=CAMNT_0027354247 /DNA_START=120 /DNA_END=2915 /DNA_ORIENTATION=-
MSNNKNNQKPVSFHMGRLGGKYNVMHHQPNNNSRSFVLLNSSSNNNTHYNPHDEIHYEIIPPTYPTHPNNIDDDHHKKFLSPTPVPSLTRANIINEWGHYVHDEYRSPFASHIYDREPEELEKEQEEYETKMQQIRDTYGGWNFRPPQTKTSTQRELPSFDTIPYGDLPSDQFPSTCWQNDPIYVQSLLGEGKALLHRVKEGIYAEYGYPTLPDMNPQQIEERNKLFQIQILPNDNDNGSPRPKDTNGVGWITERTHDMLVRKILHAMITNDNFYVVLGGHSAAAGHGNNFLQTKALQLQYLMEPIFDKLGMKLFSRNMAMGGLGTLHFSMGQSTLYGEKDILWWDSSMTEKQTWSRDLFNRQGLLGGERVPILLTPTTYNLEEVTGGQLWQGNTMDGNGIIKLTESDSQAKKLPWAVRYLRCDERAKDLCNNRDNKYHSTCWEPRSDLGTREGDSIWLKHQAPFVSGQASWHPGDKEHLFESRKVALIIMHGLESALQLWEDYLLEQQEEKQGNENNKHNSVLPDTYWHVGSHFQSVQEAIQNYAPDDDPTTSKSNCVTQFVEYPHICKIPMKGMSEFTPINLGDQNSIRKHVKAAPNGYRPYIEDDQVYDGPDILSNAWKIPLGEVDVHAIAIATLYDKEEWVAKQNQNEGEEEENRRYLLRTSNNHSQHPNRKDMTPTTVSNTPKIQSRQTAESPPPQPGQGWSYVPFKSDKKAGYCDGSSMITCGRSISYSCLNSGHNDGHATIAGDSLSGWLIVNVPNVREGLILMRSEWWSVRGMTRTKDWKELNAGLTMATSPKFFKEVEDEDEDMGNRSDETQEEVHVLPNDIYNFNHQDSYHRMMGGNVPPLPNDFKFDVSINGKIVHSWNKDEFMKLSENVVYNVEILLLMNDQSFKTDSDLYGSTVELGFRVSSKSDTTSAVGISHIYYA